MANNNNANTNANATTRSLPPNAMREIMRRVPFVDRAVAEAASTDLKRATQESTTEDEGAFRRMMNATPLHQLVKSEFRDRTYYSYRAFKALDEGVFHTFRFHFVLDQSSTYDLTLNWVVTRRDKPTITFDRRLDSLEVKCIGRTRWYLHNVGVIQESLEKVVGSPDSERAKLIDESKTRLSERDKKVALNFLAVLSNRNAEKLWREHHNLHMIGLGAPGVLDRSSINLYLHHIEQHELEWGDVPVKPIGELMGKLAAAWNMEAYKKTLVGGARNTPSSSENNELVHVLGRARKVTKVGRKSMVTYEGRQYSLTEARQLEKVLARKKKIGARANGVAVPITQRRREKAMKKESSADKHSQQNKSKKKKGHERFTVKATGETYDPREHRTELRKGEVVFEGAAFTYYSKRAMKAPMKKAGFEGGFQQVSLMYVPKTNRFITVSDTAEEGFTVHTFVWQSGKVKDLTPVDVLQGGRKESLADLIAHVKKKFRSCIDLLTEL